MSELTQEQIEEFLEVGNDIIEARELVFKIGRALLRLYAELETSQQINKIQQAIKPAERAFLDLRAVHDELQNLLKPSEKCK